MLYLSLGCAMLAGLAALTMVDVAAAADDNPVVVLETTMGPVTIELDRAKAPITVDNFLKYVDSGFYNGLIFHRVIPGFMVQGGGFTDAMKEKEGVLNPIQNEGGNGLKNLRGTLAMARTNDPNSATCQFFINLADHDNLDRNAGSPGYAVFGKVTAGMEAIDSIAKVPTGQKGIHGDVPEKPVYIRSAKRKGK